MSAAQFTKLRVAVVGAGYVASHHLAALKRLDFVELVGICDSNLDAAKALAERFGIGMAASNLAGLAAQQPQAVYILTPPASHASLAIQALDMGCRVLVEKPMADSVAECRAMIAKAQEKGLLLGVNHSDLLDPVMMKALARVRAGHIGEVISVDILRSSEYPAYAGGPLPGQVAQGSYPFRDLGVHGLYTLEAFLGPLSNLEVRYQSSGRDPNLHFDEWQAQVQGTQGIGRMLLSWNARPMESRLVVRGTHGVITLDRFLQTLHVHRTLPGPKFIGIVINTVLSAAADCVRVPWNVVRFATGLLKPSPGIQKGAADFALAARDNGRPPIDGAAALRVIEMLEPACAEADRLRTAHIEARYQTLAPVDALVTGAAGFLGQHLVRALRARGQSVRVLLRKPNSAYASDSGIQVVIGDLGDPRAVDHAVQGTSVVYHVGAAMRGSVRDFEAGTIWGTRNIIAACTRHRSSRLVYVSSMSVFDHAGRDPAHMMTETSPQEPHPDWRGAYTRTKLAAERAVLDAIQSAALPAVIIRPGQIFGSGAEKVTPNAVVGLVGRWVAVGPGDMSLPLVHVDDVVDALLLAGENPQAVGKVFNIVDTAQVTQQEYLDRAKQKLGDELKIVRVPTGLFMALGFGVEMLGKILKRDVPLTRYKVRSLRPLANFDISAARDVLGWKPRVGVARGLDNTFGRNV